MLEFAFVLGMYTTHIGGHNYNNDNQLMAFQVEKVVVGSMKNSHYQKSRFASYDVEFNSWSGMLIGGATGYDYDCMRTECKLSERDDDDIVPIIAPYAKWKGVHALLQLNAINISYRIPLGNLSL